MEWVTTSFARPDRPWHCLAPGTRSHRPVISRSMGGNARGARIPNVHSPYCRVEVLPALFPRGVSTSGSAVPNLRRPGGGRGRLERATSLCLAHATIAEIELGES